MDFSFLTEYLHHLSEVFPVRASILLISLLCVSIFGFMYGGWKGKAIPFYWIILDKLFSGFCTKAFKQNKNRQALAFRGAGVTIIILCLSYAAGVGVNVFSETYYLYGIPTVISLAILLSSGAHWYMAGNIYKALKKGKDNNAYFSVAASSRINLNKVDESGVVRTVANFSLQSFERMIVLPSLGYIFGGLIGAFILSGASYVVWRIGRDGHGQGSATLARTILKLIGLVSAPVTTITFLAAFLIVPSANILRALKGLRFDQSDSLRIVAFAMNIILGGPAKDIDEWVVKREWIGPEKVSAQMDIETLKSVRYLLFVLTVLWCGMIVGALLAYKISFLA